MTVLNEADAIYLGNQSVDAVYLGAQKIWPGAEPLPPYMAAVVADNPLAFWPLDETDPAYNGQPCREIMGTGINTQYRAVGTGGAWSTIDTAPALHQTNQPGVDGRPCVQFNGTVALPTSGAAPGGFIHGGRAGELSPFLAATGEGTIECWAMRTNLTNHRILLSFWDQTGANAAPVDGYIQNNGVPRFSFGNGATGSAWTVPTAMASLQDTWYHVVVTVQTTSGTSRLVRTWLDGVFNTQATVAINLGDVATRDFAIGTRRTPDAQGGTSAYSFIGRLQYVALYNHVLPDNRIIAHNAIGRGQ